MDTRLSLVGAVASARALGTIALLVGLVASLPALLDGAAGIGGLLLAVLLFGVPFAWVAVARRAWCRTRLEAVTPAPQGSPVIAREDTFEAVSRPLAVPVVIGLGLGVLVASTTGVPAGLVLAGMGGALLRQAQWLAREERTRGIRLLCPHAPLRPAPDDPSLTLYRQVPFFAQQGGQGLSGNGE